MAWSFDDEPTDTLLAGVYKARLTRGEENTWILFALGHPAYRALALAEARVAQSITQGDSALERRVDILNEARLEMLHVAVRWDEERRKART